MWDRFKEKISNFLFVEVEEEEEEEQSSKERDFNSKNVYRTKQGGRTGKQNVQTKMMYQYPEKGHFRFPVIPDEPEKEKYPARPAYERKRLREKRESKTSQPVQRSERKSNTEKDMSVPKKNRPVPKRDSNVPFKASDVPSPIYGFHRKKENKVEEIPAYQRKKMEEPEKTESQPSLVDTYMQETAATVEADEKHGRRSDQQKEASKVDSQIVSDIPATENPEERAVEQHEETQQQKDLQHYNTKKSPTERRTERIRSKPKGKNNHKKKPQDGPKTPPFNVMMSANDKMMQKMQMQRRKPENRKPENPPVSENTSDKQSFSVPYHLLNDPVPKSEQDQLWMRNQQELLEKTLQHFNVRAKVVNMTQGPSVTRFEVQPELGVKVSKVKNLSDDLKLNMAARDIRIEAPIPGKNTIGIEIPNPKAQMVGLQEIFETDGFQKNHSPLTIGLGLSIEGSPLITNIQKMPHGLIAGATGSGKSVCINTILISLIYKASHEDVKFLLIDPKMVELAPYNGIPHLLSPVITDVKAATMALKWAVSEMEDRYERFVKEGVRDVERYNQKMAKQNRSQEKMPFIVIVIDELADLMMMSPQDVEDAICRIAQKARACGIHLLLATQRPSVDVITGLIKANIPTRIAFSVSSQVDSRTILDTSGAEKLLGKGDMLFIENGAGKSIRLQGAFVSDEEIERVTEHARSIAEPEYAFEQEQLLEQIVTDDSEDELLEEAIAFVIRQNSASTSLLQRQFKVGYNRAARLMDSMETRGIIAGQNGSKPREVLVSETQLES
ncbi:DNA translocase FtsK [Virgibacillus kekensis]|uniref:DNA translocase FtsK n=1 Tax=Virgibacillus kekensis TaxID=202261 RepID=A0ABV9DG05_9BACI